MSIFDLDADIDPNDVEKEVTHHDILEDDGMESHFFFSERQHNEGLFDNVEDHSKELSTERGIGTVMKRANAYEKEATNASETNALDKMSDEDLEEQERKKQEKKDIRNQNRKEALGEAGEALIAAAKATGKGVKETARLAYNLVTGSDK